jgi:hypothetical protein
MHELKKVGLAAPKSDGKLSDAVQQRQERRSRPSFDMNAQLAADRSGGHRISSM